MIRFAFSKDHYDKNECKMTSGKATAVHQGSKDGALAMDDGEKLTSLREREELIQRDVMMNGTCSEQEELYP